MPEGSTIAIAIAASGLGITLIVLLLRGGFLLGRLSNQVDGLTIAVGELRAEMQQSEQRLRAEAQQSEQRLRAEMQQNDQRLRAEMQQGHQALLDAISELRAEVQQSNHTLAVLTNHTHDTDGRTVFQVPPPVNR